MKKSIWYISLSLLCCTLNTVALDTLLPKSEKLFQTETEKRKEQLDIQIKRLDELDRETTEFNEETRGRIESVKLRIARIKEELESAPDDDFSNRSLTILNEWYQTIKDRQQVRESLVSTMREQKALLANYVQDPDQKAFKKELNLADDRVYSFEELTDINERKELLGKQKSSLQEQVKNISVELDNRKRSAAAAENEFNQKKKKYKESSSRPQSAFAFTDMQVKEIFLLEEGLFRSKERLFALQKEEIEQKRDLLRAKLLLVSARIDILTTAFDRIKSSIRITESEVMYARSELKKKQQQLNAQRQEKYDPAREKIEADITAAVQKRKDQENEYNVSFEQHVADWGKTPQETVDAWSAYADVGLLQNKVLLLEQQRDMLGIQLAQEEEKNRLQELLIDIQDTFLKKDSGRFSSEEKINQELKHYESQRTKIKATLASINNKKNAAQAKLNGKKQSSENLKNRIQEVESLMRPLFRGKGEQAQLIITQLEEGQQLVAQEIELLTSFISICQDIISILEREIDVIEFVVAELESIRVIWQRPEHAISWAGIKRIIPEIEQFAYDVQLYILLMHKSPLILSLKNVIHRPFNMAKTLFQLFVLLALIFLVSRLLAIIRSGIGVIVDSVHGLLRVLLLFTSVIIDFSLSYFVVLGTWFFAFLVLYLYVYNDPYIFILFYLFSIPLLLIIFNRFIAAFTRANQKYDYCFVSKEFQGRWRFIISFLGYATIIIFFFRQAFMMAGYSKSELPNILLAINFIILQISVIFLIAKEQILNIIPQTNEMWIWLREQIDDYYYLILLCMVAIIVMINPYVGFGKLVLYVLTHVIYTILLILTLYWTHTGLKKTSSILFFQTEQDSSVKERFVGAKTWYGVFIISLLLSLLFFGAIFIAKIWGWPEALNSISSFGDILTWLKKPVFGTEENPISVYTSLYLLFFLLFGFVVSFLIKRFVLARIFDVLLVDAGVQYTVTSIMRYLVMLVALVLGFNAVGLGQQMNYIITAVVFGIAWVVKEPIADFFSYFIILVQRPVKIGDYIYVNSDVAGVVRRITPRSVVLRRRNSTMIVVPNSFLMNKPIVNWNYSRGFIAFSDIIVTIDYDEDPQMVKELLRQIVDENQFVLKNPKPVIRLDDFGDYGYMFMIRGFLSSNYTLDQWNIASDIRLQIVKTCREQNVKLALPIRVTISKKESSPKAEGPPHGMVDSPVEPTD